ncbi:MAG: DMT family transporter [Actinomycetota bacterium]|nr:DMT family transporter [Actinomycetota bacterium]
MLAVVCAVLAAGMYAAASVLQQRSAAAESQEHALRLGLLTRLVQNPMWLLGVGADIAGYVLQFVALGNGTLVVVQPLLVCGLLFALPIGAHWGGSRLRAKDWVGAVAVCAGLAVFLIVARPARGHDNVHLSTWIALLGAAAVVCAVMLAACRHRSLRQRAVLLSGVAGVSYGVSAALTKASAHLLSRGIPVLLAHWQPYVLVAIGVAGMVVSQSAFQAGTLDASLPTMTVVDPIVSILIGAVAFGESLDIGAITTSTEVIALIVMTIGVFLLVRTKAVRGLHESPSEPRVA